MTKYVGCIDIHGGQVKQIVGGTLEKDDREEDVSQSLATNFVSEKPSSYYAQLYKDNNVTSTHVIKLGSLETNDEAAREALRTWPNHMQIGGGINDTNAAEWIALGASKVIITSWLFPQGEFSLQRLQKISGQIGKDRLVVDLSCRKRIEGGKVEWVVAMNKWQTLTSTVLNRSLFDLLEQYCSEFLVHAADVEGLCQGIDQDLVKKLSEWTDFPMTYAGGAKSLEDLRLVDNLSNGKVDLTFGSALDIFGGNLVKFEDCCEWNRLRK
ncbi:unnamed protein product [Kuraishia capsulata CBS 1993]|uniref:1-(5-phosphoribosyl)-5-[(5-phosphoribosylamino)methylideneamino] imidazole-4-carboxamide isomerase n=1 Tax=Kuraishia capsulata CBS 1993 TaxID=1382522 RepID=W6MHD7_9ASCO|nr:uncharacterized protein KUCA_T00001040001 [Kuraishia capsulata CBS 1993]CDK25073.1 unnamed protein product [Kuraishia capsulata CBS 1993]